MKMRDKTVLLGPMQHIDDGWDEVGRSLEKDLGRAMAFMAAGLAAIGGIIAVGVDVLWRRHHQ